MIIGQDQIEKYKKRYTELEQQLSNASLDPQTRQPLQKEYSYISNLINKIDQIQNLEKEIIKAQDQKSKEKDPELLMLYDQEINSLNSLKTQSEKELEDFLFPADPLDNRSVFLEIRAGTGGQEAALFAGDLARMYTNYALKKNWKAAVVTSSTTDLGGFREIILHIEGKGVFGHLKHESGVHRVQRVPRTETAGRIHTSTATVAVLPEAEEVELSVNPADLRIDVYRSGGAGGQHVNTTDSAVRITHIPTGVVVTCQDERSQHKNKAKALKVLQSRLLQSQKEKSEAEMSQKRKELVGTGERAEKVRTYNFPQNRITDHQVEMTLNKLDHVIEGDLDDIIDALIQKEKQERKQHGKFK
ncbi:peptide chain release factor 1 [Candidatus Dependentiae bacterium]|nr:peptide chain release factor 1 [Candidatus Dependentiae bacterium]